MLHSLPAGIGRAELDAAAGEPSFAGRLAAVVAERIRSGVWPAATRLPSIRAMAKACSLGPETVVRAYDRLVQEGLVKAVKGSGFYVRSIASGGIDLPKPPPLLSMPTWNPLVANDLPLDRRPGTGVLHPDFLPTAEVARAARAALRTRQGLLSDPGDASGYRPLREQIVRDLAHDGIAARVEDVVTGHGATGAMNVIVRALLRPGDYAVMEAPGPFIHQAVLMSQGVEIATVRREADGPDIAALRATCERVRPRLLLCSAILQNPTGSSIAAYKAYRILQLAEEFDMTVIDDAAYAALRPAAGQPATPLAALDGFHRVIHVGSFSRTTAAGLGLGYLVAGERLMNWLRVYRAIHSLSGPMFAERTLYHLMAEGRFRRACGLIAARLVERRALVGGWLAAAGIDTRAEGAGPFLWTSLGAGTDMRAVAARMRAGGYVVTSRNDFSYAPEDHDRTRLNVTTTTRAAVDLLAAAVRRGA